MKQLLALVFITLSLQIFSQQDSVTLPITTVIESAQRMQRLERSDSIKTAQLAVFRAKVLEMDNVIKTHESIVDLKNQEIAIYTNILSNFVDLPTNKRKWYNSPEFIYASGVISGGLILFTGAKLVISLK